MCDICNTIKKSLSGENPYFVKELKTGIVVIGWNQHFYGYTLFMCKRHATELYELESEFQAEYLKEMVVVSQAVSKAFDAEKMVIWESSAIMEKVRFGGCHRKLCGMTIISRYLQN